MRLIDRLVEMGQSRADAKRSLASGKVFTGGVPTALAVREVEPEDVQLRKNAPRLRPGADLVLVERAPGYVVVWKPPHLLSVPAPGRESEPSVLSQVEGFCGSALAVHRLDEDTSGLMLVALDEPTQLHLKDALAAREISRAYLALVTPPLTKGWTLTVRNNLVRDRGDGRRGVGEGPDAKAAVTHLQERERVADAASLVEARLETGRTHQIRIHLAHLGHPVLGDQLYGSRRAGPIRLALHAYSLAFKDPAGEQKEFEVPLPDDMTSFIQRGGRAAGDEKTDERPRERRPSRRRSGR